SSTAKVDLTATLDRAYNTFVKNGVPVIIGEFGLLGFDKDLGTIQRGELLKFFEYLTYHAQERELPLMLWDNGQHFQRRLGRWIDQTFYEVIMTEKGVRSSYTDTDSVFLKKGAEIKDRHLLLELNGNELLSITLDGRELEKGVDWDIAFGRLALKAQFLERFNLDEYGVVGTLKCQFSAGVPWEIYIISHDTPVLEAVESARNRFRIPVQFKGDLLATMEAVYEKGGNAGPADWTSYKEFGSSFKPLYEQNSIELPAAFFKDIKDGVPVKLKFHFWSGERVEYTVTKNKMQVIGTP
ncbi:MAG: X2-like carbohydrate binding domain-containing protein, partial [Bacillota bacterium]|nr:X2-like carbohydrate binding domain-containing protein [Bacillota bacterium]